MPTSTVTPGRCTSHAQSRRNGRILVAGVVAWVGLGAATGAPRANAATGSTFCTEAQTELAKLGAIAKNSSVTATAAKATSATLKAQLEPFLKTYRDSSSKLQKGAPSNLRTAVKAYLDQGAKGLVALEKAGWDIKKLPRQIPDPANFTTVTAPLVAYAKSTCGVTLLPMSQLSPSTSALGSAKAGAKHADPVELKIPACSLYSKTEAEKLIGVAVVQLEPGINGASQCTYNAVKAGQGQVNISVVPPSGCKLLILALDANLFGGKQVRVDDIGDGGMLVKGNGNVQFTTHGGCVAVSSRNPTGSLPDDTVLALAKLVESRVKG